MTRHQVSASGVHYDVPPRVFERMLDPHMNYSSAYYLRGDEKLDLAQKQKMDKVATLCALKRGDRLLDLGCGWGGPLLYFAEQYECCVTGLTLSEVQRDWGQEWARRRGLSNRVEIRVADALEADLGPKSFDHAVFLESIIHMKDKGRLFELCRRVLKPSGTVFVQESCYDRQSLERKYRDDRGFQAVDQVFGFSGAMTSGAEMLRLMEEAGLVPVYLENISAHYERTLSRWAENLDRHAEEMKCLAPEFFPSLRRYIMLALGTYRAGNTLCHMIAAQKPPHTWAGRSLA